MPISQSRAEFIARSHACVSCLEYTWRKVNVREAQRALNQEFGEVWHATLVCGVCDRHQELGIDDDGDIVYVT